MKLSCPSCSAKYSIADEKVQDRLAKIRCRKCSATIIVDGKVNPPSVYTSEAGGAAGDATDATGGPMVGEYSVDFGDNDQRTMSMDDITQAYSRGEITVDTFVWAEGFSDWTAIRDVPELAELLGGASAPAPRAAARTGAGRGSAHDLFGGIETAGSEEDVMTSAPQAQAPAAAAAATGARNESSVLFSLSALTASAPAAPPPPKGNSAPSAVANGKDDDSGLIDLKALTSAVSAQAPSNPLVLGTAPLGMAAPLGGMTAPAIATDSAIHRPASSKTGLYIAAAMVFVGVLIAGAIVFKGSQEPPPSAVAAAPVAPAPTAAPAPEAKKEEPQPTAAPPATGTAETKEAAPTKQTSAPKAVAHYSAPKKSTAAEKPVAAEKPAEKPTSHTSDDSPPPPKKKKEKTCNCSPGDLMCAMKCAAS